MAIRQLFKGINLKRVQMSANIIIEIETEIEWRDANVR